MTGSANPKDTIMLVSLTNGEKMVGKVEFEDSEKIILKNPRIIVPISHQELGLASPSLIGNGDSEVVEINKGQMIYKIIVNNGTDLYNLYIQATTNIKIATPKNSNLKLVPPSN